MTTKKISSNKKYLLIDTCVIQDAGSSTKSKSDGVLSFLKSLAEEGFDLVISEFTIYENLQGLWGKKATEAGEILKNYESKEVSRKVLIMASLFLSLYREERIENISDGDKIIAATAVLEDGLILTRNHKDFPSPFFINTKYSPIAYQTNHHSQTLDYIIYKPNIPLLNRRVGENENKNL